MAQKSHGAHNWSRPRTSAWEYEAPKTFLVSLPVDVSRFLDVLEVVRQKGDAALGGTCQLNGRRRQHDDVLYPLRSVCNRIVIVLAQCTVERSCLLDKHYSCNAIERTRTDLHHFLCKT